MINLKDPFKLLNPLPPQKHRVCRNAPAGGRFVDVRFPSSEVTAIQNCNRANTFYVVANDIIMRG
jgi:hypothetical protein